MSALSSLATHVTAPVNVVLMRTLLSAAKRTFPYMNGTTPGTLERKQGSATVKWRRINNLALATTALGELTGNAAYGQGHTAVTPDVTDITQAIAKYGNYFNTTEELDLFNVNSDNVALVETLGENAGASLNALVRDEMGNATNVRRAGGVAVDSTIAAAVTANDLKYVVNQLQRQSAMKFFPIATGSDRVGSNPIRASYFSVTHPDVEEDVRDLSDFKGVETYAGHTGTFVGEYGSANGIRFASSEIAPITTVTSSVVTSVLRGASTTIRDLYDTFVYGREAVGTVGLDMSFDPEIYMGGDRPSPVEIIVGAPQAGPADPFKEVTTLAWKAWHASKVLNENWIWKVRTGASSLA